MKKTVTIGISALNEEGHIFETINSLLSQNMGTFVLDQIIIISDGSTDKTVSISKSISSNLIKVVDSKERLGKPKRMNQIFSMSNSDILIILDADLIIKEPLTIMKLISPFNISKKIQLVSGYAYPLESSTFSQKIGQAGLNIWEYSKRIAKNSEMYYCGGPVRAFGKLLYKKVIFPNNSADDVYPYLYMQGMGFEFKYISNTDICYRLPRTMNDYIKQTRRFIKSPQIQEKNCGKEKVQKNFTIGWKIKLTSAIHYLIIDPVWTSLYILTSVLIHVLDKIDKKVDKSTWEMIISTKT